MTRLGRSPPLVRQSMYDGLSSYYTLSIRIHRLSCQVCMLFLSARWRPTLPRRCSRVLSLERTGSRLRQRGTAGFFVIKTKMFTSRKFHPKQIWSTTYCQRGGGSLLENTTRPFFFFGSSNDFLLYLKLIILKKSIFGCFVKCMDQVEMYPPGLSTA